MLGRDPGLNMEGVYSILQWLLIGDDAVSSKCRPKRCVDYLVPIHDRTWV